MTLEIKNLHVTHEGKEILKGVNLTVKEGEVHALMGPNGSGKTTLAYVLMGHPKYKVASGDILFNGESILKLSSNERAKKGFFLSFQSPVEVSGVSISNFLRQSYNSTHEQKLSILEFRKLLDEKASELNLSKEFLSRYLNKDFSGGEKKKLEILQMLMLNPKFVVLDETDSGLDIDSLKIVAEGIDKFKTKEKTILIITHYKRILDYVKPDSISVLDDGRIVLQGDGDIADSLEKKGYKNIMEKD